MNVFGVISLLVVVLCFFAVVVMLIRPREEKYFGIEKKWFYFGGLGVLWLATVFFYVAGYQPNNVVQNVIVNGVTKTYTIQTMDLPGSTYFDFVNWMFLLTSLFYIVGIIRESSFLGVYRENRRAVGRR
jgi:hypothetical protein